MALYVNEIFPGLETDEREGLLDVYAFLVGSDVYVEVLQVRLSMEVARSKFISAMVNRMMSDLPPNLRNSPSRKTMLRKKFAPRREFVEEDGVWTIRESGGEIGAYLYLVYDSNMKRMHMSPESTPSLEVEETTGSGPMNTALLKSVTAWISEYFDAPQEDLEFAAGPIPFKDYEIHTLSEYPIIYQMAVDLRMSIRVFDQMNVLLIDYRKPTGPRGQMEETEIFRRLVDELDGFDGSQEVQLIGDFFGGTSFASEAFVYEEDGKRLFALEPPFYVVNRQGKEPIGIANMLLQSIISDRSGEGVSTPESQLRDNVRLSYYMGRDSGDLMYSLTQSGVFTRDFDLNRQDIVNALGVEETEDNRESINLLCFLDLMMSIYGNMDTSGVGDPFDKRYYTTVATGNIRHREIFDAIFEVVDEGGDMMLVRSPFNLPPEVFALFGLPGVVDMYTLDPNSSILSGNLQYTVDRQRNKREWLGTPGSTPSPLLRSMKEDAEVISPEVEDRHNENLMVHALSSIPACRVPAQQMFDKRGVEFHDIRIILLRYAQNPGMLGGFVGAHQNRKLVDVFTGVKPFSPPFIMLNMLAPGMSTQDERIIVILHEVSHFIDEILVTQGRAEPTLLWAPQQSQSIDSQTQISFWNQYLGKSKTERQAHAEEVYYLLSMYDFDYALRNKPSMRRKIVDRLLGSVHEQEPPAVTLERRKLYNAIFDRGWEMFEDEYLKDVDTVPSLDEEGEEPAKTTDSP